MKPFSAILKIVEEVTERIKDDNFVTAYYSIWASNNPTASDEFITDLDHELHRCYFQLVFRHYKGAPSMSLTARYNALTISEIQLLINAGIKVSDVERREGRQSLIYDTKGTPEETALLLTKLMLDFDAEVTNEEVVGLEIDSKQNPKDEDSVITTYRRFLPSGEIRVTEHRHPRWINKD